MAVMDMFSGVGDKIQQNPDLFSVLAGTAGSAIAGPDTWQGRLGGAAAQIGQGNIAASEADKNRQQTMQLLQSILGGGQPAAAPATPETPAPTSGLGDLTNALSAAGVQMPSQSLGSLTQPTAPAAPAAPAAPGGGQGQDPFWRRLFQR